MSAERSSATPSPTPPPTPEPGEFEYVGEDVPIAEDEPPPTSGGVKFAKRVFFSTLFVAFLNQIYPVILVRPPLNRS